MGNDYALPHFREREVLKNPPIIEALLEVKWDYPKKGTPVLEPISNTFQFFLGIFYDKIKTLGYKEIEQILPPMFPEDMNPELPRYRFRKIKNGYPLVQLGPAILTINVDKSGFSQDTFHDTCMEVLKCFLTLQPEIKLNHLLIHYIDAFNFDYEKLDPFVFLKEKLETTFAFNPELFAETKISPLPESFHFESNYKVSDPAGFFMCQLRSGLRKSDNQKLIVMDSIFHSPQINLPNKDPDSISSWIKKADDLICEWFYRMIKNMKEVQ